MRSNGSGYRQCTFVIKIIKIENGSKKTFATIPKSAKFANISSMNDSQYTVPKNSVLQILYLKHHAYETYKLSNKSLRGIGGFS